MTETANPVEFQQDNKERNLIFLGHDVGIDLDYLQKLGSEVFNPTSVSDDLHPGNISELEHKQNLKRNRGRILASVLEILDTSTLYKTFKNEPNPRSLSHVCYELGIDAWFVHNAGNDARYTLEALIKLAIKAQLDEDQQQRLRDPTSTGVHESEWEAEQERYVDERLERMRRKAEKKFEDGRIADHQHVSVQPMTAPTTDGDDNIDWSLPLRGERPSKKPKGSDKGPKRYSWDLEKAAVDNLPW